MLPLSASFCAFYFPPPPPPRPDELENSQAGFWGGWWVFRCRDIRWIHLCFFGKEKKGKLGKICGFLVSKVGDVAPMMCVPPPSAPACAWLGLGFWWVEVLVGDVECDAGVGDLVSFPAREFRHSHGETCFSEQRLGASRQTRCRRDAAIYCQGKELAVPEGCQMPFWSWLRSNPHPPQNPQLFKINPFCGFFFTHSHLDGSPWLRDALGFPPA